jgi:peroxiredoxin (alkyl hydroperoxide reductase subunit C)
MTIKVGDKIPSMKLAYKGPDGIQEVTTDEIFKGKTVVLFSVPGAFTPTCSAKHLPGFVQNADAIKKKGVDQIVCTSVNDPFVMDAWGKDQKVGDKVFMLPDGSGNLAKAMGMEFDLTARGLGVRGQRYAMVVKDGVVKSLRLEEPGKFEVSSAEAVMKDL